MSTPWYVNDECPEHPDMCGCMDCQLRTERKFAKELKKIAKVKEQWLNQICTKCGLKKRDCNCCPF
jgi:hypothetical protein